MTLARGYAQLQVRERAIDAIVSGQPLSSVAASYGVSRRTIYRWWSRYQQKGSDGLERQVSPGSGRPRLLASISDAAFEKLLVEGATSQGYGSDLWTAVRLAYAIKKVFAITVSRNTVLRRLKDAGFSYQKPEKYFAEMDEEKRARWRRNEIPKIRRCVAQFRAILYFEDEAHVAMATVLGKTWAHKGRTPKARSSGQRGGISAISSVSQRGDLIFRISKERIASPQIIEFLQQMLSHHRRRHLVVVMDQARPHVSRATKAFVKSQPRLHVFYLPPYSPDYNPDEKVWNHLKHVENKNECFKDKADLRRKTRRGLHRMSKSPRQVRGIFYRSVVTDFLG